MSEDHQDQWEPKPEMIGFFSSLTQPERDACKELPHLDPRDVPLLFHVLNSEAWIKLSHTNPLINRAMGLPITVEQLAMALAEENAVLRDALIKSAQREAVPRSIYVTKEGLQCPITQM
jgi:hypothetical protein